jgi:phosphoribosyl-ATP pyrophosphohydrolase
MASEIGEVLDALYATLIARRGADPSTSYVASLYAKGADTILKKIGEEAAETIIAGKDCASGGAPEHVRLVSEVADLCFHVMVLMAAYDVPLSSLSEELARRTGRSGLVEKASRSAN